MQLCKFYDSFLIIYIYIFYLFTCFLSIFMHITQYIITCLLICNALFFGYDTVIAQKVNLSGIINNYARVLQLDNCKNYIKVDNSFGFEAGDKAILIQMKGALINTDDSSTFGDIIDFKGAGNAEVVEISSVQNDLINLKYSPLLDYYPSDAPVQLVSLPGYDTATITSKLTAKPWDGLTGGVLAFDIRLALDISGTIDISGRGYRGDLHKMLFQIKIKSIAHLDIDIQSFLPIVPVKKVKVLLSLKIPMLVAEALLLMPEAEVMHIILAVVVAEMEVMAAKVP